MSSTETTTPVAAAPKPALKIDWVRLSPVIYTIGLFVIWELGARISGLPHTILPTPTRVFEAIFQYWSPIWKNSVQTLYTTVLGFLIAIVAGLGIGPRPSMPGSTRSWWGSMPFPRWRWYRSW